MKKFLILLVFTGKVFAISIGCDFSIKQVSAASQTVGMTEGAIIYTKGKVDVLELQMKTLEENPDLKRSMGMTRVEIQSAIDFQKNQLINLEEEYKNDALHLMQALDSSRELCK